MSQPEEDVVARRIVMPRAVWEQVVAAPAVASNARRKRVEPYEMAAELLGIALDFLAEDEK